MRLRFATVVSALLAAGAWSAAQQPSSNDPRALLAASLAAYGGADVVGNVRAVRFRDVGRAAAHDQSPSPDPPYPLTAVEDAIVTDPYGERVVRHERSPAFEQIFLIDGHEAWLTNPVTKRASPLAPGTIESTRRTTPRRIPAFLVLEAAGRAPFARTLDDATYDGRPHQIVEVALVDGTVLRLWFDRGTRLLSKHERHYVDAALGDAVEETAFSGHRAVGGIQMPSRYTVRRNAFVAREAEFADVEIDPRLDATPFTLPAGIERRAPEPRRPFHAVTKLADRVYVLEQVAGVNSNVMFIDQDDGVVVVEAPEERTRRGLSERAIATIKRTLPGKRIRYVVPSHHHVDHGGGLRAYIAEGATILTTPGNAAWVARVAAAPSTLQPDALARHPRPPLIERIEGKQRVLRSGTHLVELHDVAPEPHAHENVAVWLPAERILFLGDLFETGYREDVRWDGAGQLGNVLGRHKWDVDLIVTPHSRPRRMRDLRPQESR
jgi:glyoxylase-like metal-dependent hydrolase (beta-lactamase superfamily II)